MDKNHVIEYLYNISTHRSGLGSVFLSEYNNWQNALLKELPAEINFYKKNQQNPQKLINFNDLITVIKGQMDNYESKLKILSLFEDPSGLKEPLEDPIILLNGKLWEFMIELEKVWVNDCTSLDLVLKKISNFEEKTSTQIILSNSNNISAVVESGDTMSLNVVEYVINSQNVSASSNGSNLRINTNINSNLSYSYNGYNGFNGRVNSNVDNLFSADQAYWFRADSLNLPNYFPRADYYLLTFKELQDISINPLNIENKPSLEVKSGKTVQDYGILINLINYLVETDGLTNDNFKTVHDRYYNNSDKLCGYKLGGLNTSKNLKNCNQLIAIDFHGNLWKDTPKYLEHILNTKIMNTFTWFSNYYGIDVSIYDFLNLKGQGTINENSSILINKLNSNGIINLNDSHSRLIGGDNGIDLNTSKNPLFMKSWYVKSPLFYGLHKNNINETI